MDYSHGFDQSDYFLNSSGLHLFKKTWKPDNPEKIKAAVLVVHGYGEHCQRYQRLADELRAINIVVYSHDHVGHGKSEGKRMHVPEFDAFVKDVLHHADHIKEEYFYAPLFLFGHSMGGTIAILAALQRPTFFAGLILSSPIALPNRRTPTQSIRDSFKGFLHRAAARFFPKATVGNLPPRWVCRDPAEVENFKTDPLIWKGGLKVGFSIHLNGAMKEIEENVSSIDSPLLVLHGTEDKLIGASSSRELVEKARSDDKSLKEYEGFYHELINEPEEDRKQVLADIVEWLKARI